MRWITCLVWISLAACSPSEEARATCRQAAERYAVCMRETMGPEMEAMVRGKEDIDSCAKSDRTVELYRTCCLPKKTCDEFMDCTMNLAMGSETCDSPPP
jgi:hypothetical protein